MNRREFLSLSSATAASVVVSSKLVAQEVSGPHPVRNGPTGVQNSSFSLSLNVSDGLDCTLVHQPSGALLAKGPYYYSVGLPRFDEITEEHGALTFRGTTESGLEISHRFEAGRGAPWIEENLSIKNIGPAPYKGEPRFAFTLPSPAGTFKGYTFTAVPFRREPHGNRSQYADYSLHQILHEKRKSGLRGTMKWNTWFQEGVATHNIDGAIGELPYEQYGSEGWAVTNGTTGFLITKYNPRAMEWTLLDPFPTATGGPALRWGGAGIYCGDPEPACELAPGETFHFGTTRLTAFAGDLTEGYYTFRAEMESRGHKVPNGFNAPLHWNELYDNKLWWLPHGQMNEPEKRREFYKLSDMEIEAAKAHALSCEALYLDPGWDVSFASKIWDQSRLGTPQDFVALMQSKYHLKVSLHAPLSCWCDPTSYAYECCRMDEEGSRDRLSLCGASDQYTTETVRRLNVLADAGITFFMFDGSMSNGPCWDKEHGHPVPSRRHDHLVATDLIANRVHEKHPDVQIEMHDCIIGAPRYVPMYIGYGKDAQGKSSGRGYDTIWAFELMWAPMQNLSEGNSICLYYYNLAYSQPLYLHVDLRTDNAQAIVFWWNASTCRHYGIGGTHPDEGVRAAHRKAVADYIRLKPHFAGGTFYGLDETTHVHRHPTASTAVINVFNLDSAPATKTVSFSPARLGLAPGKSYKFDGADFTHADGVYTAHINIAPMGHQLVEVS